MSVVLEEGGKTARSLFESMRESPVTLALVIFNVVFLGVMYFSLAEERDSRNRLIDYMVQTNDKTATMLYNCTASRLPPWSPLEPQPAPPEKDQSKPSPPRK